MACSSRHEQRRRRQHGQPPRLHAPGAADPADDRAADGGDHDDAGPGPEVHEDRHRGVRARRPLQRGDVDPVQVALAADQQRGRDQDGQDGQQGQRAGRGELAARPGQRGEQGEHEHHGIEQGRRVRGRVGQRQRGPGGDHPAGRVRPVPGPDDEPGGQRDQEQRHGVVGGERAQVQRRAEHGEQRRGEERGPAAGQQAGSGPQQRGGAEHEDEGQDPGRGQPSGAVGQRGQRRVDDRCPGEVRGERRYRGAVQQPGPFQMAGPQVERFVLERRVRPDQPERQGGLDGEHHEQRPVARYPQPGRPPWPGRGVRARSRLRG